jgi:glycerol-3-phosphate acyltransferase PlsY
MEIGYLAVFYLIGSIPVAWLVGKLAGGTDIRHLGSGNVGVMNVALNVSRWAALVVFMAEIAKGILSVYLARELGMGEAMTGLAVVSALIGTRCSIWIYGRGGRGNTLVVAALLALAWPCMLIGLGVWIIARLALRTSFRATRVWWLSLPVCLGLVTDSWAYALMGAALALLSLSVNKIETDDHTLLKARWPNLWAFLTAPPRHRQEKTESNCRQNAAARSDTSFLAKT